MRVPLLYQPRCPVSCCHGKLGQSEKSVRNLNVRGISSLSTCCPCPCPYYRIHRPRPYCVVILYSAAARDGATMIRPSGIDLRRLRERARPDARKREREDGIGASERPSPLGRAEALKRTKREIERNTAQLMLIKLIPPTKFWFLRWLKASGLMSLRDSP